MNTSDKILHKIPLAEQGNHGFSCTYEKPQLMELAVPSSVVRGGSDYDLGKNRYFTDEDGNPIEDETEE